MPLARAELESLLRTRQLDRTLTTALPPVDPRDEPACASTGHRCLRRAARRRVPARSAFGARRSAIVGAHEPAACRCSRRRPARGELVALVDALDMFDVESAAAAGDRSRSAALDSRPRRHESRAVPRHESARDRAGDQRASRSSCRPATSVSSCSMSPKRRATRCAGCRSRRGCGCSAWSKGARRRACWSAGSRWRAVRRG